MAAKNYILTALPIIRGLFYLSHDAGFRFLGVAYTCSAASATSTNIGGREIGEVSRRLTSMGQKNMIPEGWHSITQLI